MKERRGPIGQVSGLADSIAGAVRRRQQRREPRVVLYDAAGHPEVLGPSAPGRAELVDVAQRVLVLAPEAEEPPPGRRAE